MAGGQRDRVERPHTRPTFRVAVDQGPRRSWPARWPERVVIHDIGPRASRPHSADRTDPGPAGRSQSASTRRAWRRVEHLQSATTAPKPQIRPALTMRLPRLASPKNVGVSEAPSPQPGRCPARAPADPSASASFPGVVSPPRSRRRTRRHSHQARRRAVAGWSKSRVGSTEIGAESMFPVRPSDPSCRPGSRRDFRNEPDLRRPRPSSQSARERLLSHRFPNSCRRRA